MNLYKLSGKYNELQNRDDLDEDTVRDTLEAIDDSFNEKANNIAGWIENNDEEINGLDKLIKQRQERKKHLKNLNKNLNAYLTGGMKAKGVKHLNFDDKRLSLRNYRQSVIIPNINEIPEEYITEKVEKKADKKKAYQDLKAGNKIKGMDLQNNERTRIE
ncbi:siphovirus Gp157 family protein [Fructilactobacillus fructivorans]|uniref:Siphovirus Gp157 family protein n=1 Tax=Fructilactobacillus fructivorans TaxID=1614 RepID=A0AAE6NZZ0_9LACO|nr:siphovirus Gp157 family protein [Fructilactobacillus fructivorans]KRK58485.1 hypothetical protein FC73_GL000037 [Fructilactobacillus fructivorans]KRN13327.1 hypothetical protein IV37_GL000040 [Fructilactobacillus fructivorans]KRN40035.1 hypothetical protein IV51_GL000214 [Fructilactobacillus fructivorans]QFX92494.1 hypothetical protein LF543_02515 [Fructilactobacillus fructivorans]RDV65910.1 hypothetical protein DXU76_01895 [Fructilactobacillus fructivorans]